MIPGVMTPRIYLVRHGETAWSLSGQHTSRTDIPLTERGEHQARDLGDLLRQQKFSEVWSSPLQRARRTCELAGFAGVMKVEPLLVEWNYGDYEGITTADIRAKNPNWNLFTDGAPNGESPSEISARADQLISRLRTLTTNIALFSHGHFLRVLAARWLGLPVREAQHFLLQTASVSILACEHNNPHEPVIALWNASLELLQPEKR
jgi:probable phosphoglycerate mutase